MGKISILAILTIFAVDNTVGQYGVWQTSQTSNDTNSLYFSLVFLLIDESKYDPNTNFVYEMRKQLVDELRANEDDYKNDPRLQHMPLEQFITNVQNEVAFPVGQVAEFELELISKVFTAEIVVCDWTIGSIRNYRKGGVTQTVYLLYPYLNHYNPLFKNDDGTYTKIFPLGDETDYGRFDEVLPIAVNRNYFASNQEATNASNKRGRR